MSEAVDINSAEANADAKEMSEIIARARAAQAQIANYTQEQVDELIRGMVWSCCQPGVAEEIAKHTLEETQLGDYNGKFLKINTKTRASLMDIIDDKSVGILEEDTERNIIKIAKPVGVIGALSPSTNPEATPVIKAINAVKGTVSIEKTEELMKQCDLILATGGAGMVKAAYSSGTPALGVGAGNAVITVDETADLDDAAEKIRMSKTLDLAASCSADNSVIVVESVYDAMVEKLVAQGGYVAKDGDYEKIAKVLWDEHGHLNTKAVVLQPQVLCKMAGVDIPEDRLFIIMPETGTGPDHPYSGEKLSVIMAFYKVKDIDEAIALTNRIQEYQGMGHSCGLYSTSEENILKMGFETKTSRVMVNQPQAASNSGNLWNGMRQTFSLGCGTWGGNSTNENINWKHLINVTWISKPLATPKTLPADEELFGDVIGKLA